MYIILSILSSLTSSLSTIYTKKIINKNNYLLITIIKSIIIFILSVGIYILYGSYINKDEKGIIYLIISGITTLLTWFSYNKALSNTSISIVSPIEKIGIIITLILSSILFNEEITLIKIISFIFILLGTLVMTYKHITKKDKIIYALLTPIFCSLTTIFTMLSKNTNVLFCIFIKTITVFLLVLIIFIQKRLYTKLYILKNKYKYITLSSLFTVISWIFYFIALSLNNTSVVYSLEKLSILFSVLLSKEILSKNKIIGLVIIVIGELLLIL